MIVWRGNHDQLWRWRVIGKRHNDNGPWARIESAVANLEEVLGVTCEWVKPKPGQRQIVTIGRPIRVEIKR